MKFKRPFNLMSSESKSDLGQPSYHNAVMTMGALIRKARLSKGMTLEQVGKPFGISPSAVSQWESGDTSPEIERFGQLARLLGVTIDYLFGEEGLTDEQRQLINLLPDLPEEEAQRLLTIGQALARQ